LFSFSPRVCSYRPIAARLKPHGAALFIALGSPAFAQSASESNALTLDAAVRDASLPTVTVTAPRESDPATEGTGLYTAPAVQIGGKTPQSQRQVPQSVSVITHWWT